MWKNYLVGLSLLAAFWTNTVAAAESPKAGAYTKVGTQRQDVKQAAEFATKQIDKGKLVNIVSAKSQVVAGTNYALVLEIEEAGGKHVKYGVVVYSPLPSSNKPMQLVKSRVISQETTTHSTHSQASSNPEKNDPEYTPEVEPDSELFTD